MPRGNQVARQCQLLQFIDRPAGITVDDAARELDCAAHRIRPDLKAFQEAGFLLFDDRGADGRRSIWRLDGGLKLGLSVKLSLRASRSS